jgi:hypothetical protein
VRCTGYDERVAMMELYGKTVKSIGIDERDKDESED